MYSEIVINVALHIWKIFFLISLLCFGEIISTEEVSKLKSSEDLQWNYEKRPFCNAFTGCYYRERRQEIKCNELKKRNSQLLPDQNNNILMFRVPDNENSSDELLTLIIDLLNQSNKKFNLSPNDFENCYRLGKRCEGKDRPVRLIFRCFEKKEQVLKSKKFSNEFDFSEDPPMSDVESRKVLLSKEEKPSILALMNLLYRENTMNIRRMNAPTENMENENLYYQNSQQ